MYVPPTRPVNEGIFEKFANINSVNYVSIDQIMRSISEKNLRRATSGRFHLSWKLDESSEPLKVYYRVPKQDCIFLEATPQDLKNVLGMQTLNNCSHNFTQAIEGQNSEPLSKLVGKFSTDLAGG